MKKHEEGQGLVEYALIMVVIALLVALYPQIKIVEALEPVGEAVAEVFKESSDVLDSENPPASQADIMTSAEQSTLEVDDVLESIETLREKVVAQEESLWESGDLRVEAVVEGIEVLINYCDDNCNQALSEAISQLMQEVKDGNPAAVPDAITLLATDLAEVPTDVSIAVLLKMAPRLIDSHATVSGGSVSPDTIAATQQALELALEQLDPDHPGKTEILQLWQVAVDVIEEGNISIEVLSEADCEVLGMIITELRSAGEEGWAEQFAADSEACGY